MAKKEETWSNDVEADLEKELRTPTPEELKLKEMAEANKGVKPQQYTLTNKKEFGLRIVHDFDRRPIALSPGETKTMMLHPSMAAHLSRVSKNELELHAVS